MQATPPSARTAVDDAYDNGAHFPDVPLWRERWQERNAARIAAADERIDLAYGPHPEQRIDLLPTPTPGRSTTAIFFHGGFWSRNSKETFRFLTQGFHAAGLNVAFAGYRLAPGARMGEIVADAQAAACWLADHLAALGLRQSPLLVTGWSSGAHLAALLTGEPYVAGGLGISGVYDLAPLVDSAMNDTLHLDASDVRRYSPATLPLSGTAPFDVAYGARELPAYREDGDAFHRALRRAGVESELLALEGHHHHSVLDELFSVEGKLVEKLAALAAIATTPRGGITA